MTVKVKVSPGYLGFPGTDEFCSEKSFTFIASPAISG